MQHINNLHFNETIHVDTFQGATKKNPSIISITDESTAYSVSTILKVKNADTLLQTLNTQWFDKFGFPGKILFKEGKVQVSQLEQKINKMAPIIMTITCKSRPTTFNTETKQQWRLNQHQLLEGEFINAVNFFHNIQNPELSETPIPQMTNQGTEKLHDIHEEQGQEDEEEVEDDLKEINNLEFEDDLEEINNLLCTHRSSNPRRKTIKLCQHKLQRGATNGYKIRTRWPQPQEEHWPQ